MIDKNEQLTMDELLFSMKQKYNDFDITPQHLGRVIRANNRTRKRTRHQHYPKERRKQLTDKNKEMEMEILVIQRKINLPIEFTEE